MMENTIQNVGQNIGTQNTYLPNSATSMTEEDSTKFSEMLKEMEILKKQLETASVGVVAKTEEVGDGLQLSPNAQAYLEQLKEKFPNYHIEVKEKFTQQDIKDLSGTMDKELGCIMNVSLLEQMASDPEVREKYENMLVEAEEHYNQLKELLAIFRENNDIAVGEDWMYIIEEVNGEFEYSIIDSEGEKVVSASSLEQLLEYLEDYLTTLTEESEIAEEQYLDSLIYSM